MLPDSAAETSTQITAAAPAACRRGATMRADAGVHADGRPGLPSARGSLARRRRGRGRRYLAGAPRAGLLAGHFSLAAPRPAPALVLARPALRDPFRPRARGPLVTQARARRRLRDPQSTPRSTACSTAARAWSARDRTEPGSRARSLRFRSAAPDRARAQLRDVDRRRTGRRLVRRRARQELLRRIDVRARRRRFRSSRRWPCSACSATGTFTSSIVRSTPTISRASARRNVRGRSSSTRCAAQSPNRRGVARGILNHAARVLGQAGRGAGEPSSFRWRRFCSPPAIPITRQPRRLTVDIGTCIWIAHGSYRSSV